MAVRWGRWIDHMPLWAALGATVSAGVYEPVELELMALPLLAAAVVGAFRWDLGSRHRWLELGALFYFLAHLAWGRGPFMVAIHTLYMLGAIRLALPREAAQRRQVVLIGFVLFLTTAMGPSDVTFLLWALAWFCAAAAALLQQSWEPSAALRRGALSRPPYRRVPLWIGGALLLAGGSFVIMPRLSLGLRPRFLLGASQSFGKAGLGDRLDLSIDGPIVPNPEVALRITPPPGVDPTLEPSWSKGLGLLRGITLETVRGFRWEPSEYRSTTFDALGSARGNRKAEFLFAPNPQGLLALPSGLTQLDPWDPYLTTGSGGSIRWRSVRARTQPVTASWNPGLGEPRESRLSPRRWDLLTQLGPEHEAARRASQQWAPGAPPPRQLAAALEKNLRGFTYTLDNPSGKAPNPLQDFLEHTRAGHCEYFASSLALMLRARGVPSRVVNGYRLGPWVPEGGYFRVSQNEAHSWVEYWDEGRWWTADPTPLGTGPEASRLGGLNLVERWADAVRYRWDRYVVRFSDQDQQAGLSWLQNQVQDWEWHWKAPRPGVLWGLGAIVSAYLVWRTRARWQPAPTGPGLIRALRPLLAATCRSAPPLQGETARAWLQRLGGLRPERREALQTLADATDALAYGSGADAAPALAKAEAAAWRRWKPSAR
ncbi:MAG: transglutaminase domain-containing protein [Acidobacteria bacterium]|nr:transglutaminase domain-containing protein [Acidobacteriota bacterium]